MRFERFEMGHQFSDAGLVVPEAAYVFAGVLGDVEPILSDVDADEYGLSGYLNPPGSRTDCLLSALHDAGSGPG
jgi:hypothetical protein